jgi:hypothetical protein
MSQTNRLLLSKRYSYYDKLKNYMGPVSNNTSNENRPLEFFYNNESLLESSPDKRFSASNATIRAARNQLRQQENIKDIYSEFISKFTLLSQLSSQMDLKANSDLQEEDESEVVSKYENSSIIATLMERIFWSRDKMSKIRTKLKTLKNKIYAKTIKDFKELITNIDCGNDKEVVYNYLT